MYVSKYNNELLNIMNYLHALPYIDMLTICVAQSVKICLLWEATALLMEKA
jgi:hypothetical protein